MTGENLTLVNEFTDLHQITAERLWDSFDMHYCCVDTLPCYVSDDWSLIISASDDALAANHNLNCWAFEWVVIEEDDYWYGTLAEYDLASPWEAFRVALRYRDAYLAGDYDNCNLI